MRAVWDDMVKNVESWSDFDVQSSLEAADDPGKRLLAYAYIFAHPDQEFINVLRRAVLADDTPFNQEMGLRALGRIIAGHCEYLDDELRDELEHSAEQFSAGKGPV